jgi:hypothetical protein
MIPCYGKEARNFLVGEVGYLPVKPIFRTDSSTYYTRPPANHFGISGISVVRGGETVRIGGHWSMKLCFEFSLFDT